MTRQSPDHPDLDFRVLQSFRNEVDKMQLVVPTLAEHRESKRREAEERRYAA